MKNFIAYLHFAHDNLSDLMGTPRGDWDSIVYTTTDEELENMAEEYSMTHSVPFTTPIYV